MTSFSGDTFI